MSPRPLTVLLGLVACAPSDPAVVPGSTEGTGTSTGEEPSEETRGPVVDGSSSDGGSSTESSDGGSSTSGESSSSESGSSTGGESSSTGDPVPVCGNAIVEDGEQCDGADLAGGSCEALGFDLGVLACAGSCAYDASGCALLPDVPVLGLAFSPIKRFDFTWAAAAGADHYQLLESPSLGEPFVQLGADILGESISLEMPLHLRFGASYVLRACNASGCTDSAEVSVAASMAAAVGYFKASNADSNDYFGQPLALSADGNTMAVGAPWESSSATGIDGNQADDSAPGSGAVHVFVRDASGAWSQAAYVKASNTDAGDGFGYAVALSGDGSVLAVGAIGERSSATGIDGNQADDGAVGAGAAYVFVQDGAGTWSQQAYVKASNTDALEQYDSFGAAVALSGDGETLAVGAYWEDGSATGIDGSQADDAAPDSGAVYVLARDAAGTWSQEAYVKASNTDAGDGFGYALALSGDGDTLAVGATGESSAAVGIDGNQANDDEGASGAVYVLVRDAMGTWSQAAYVKASDTSWGDWFGYAVTLSADGSTLAVGAPGEAGTSTGIDGDPTENGADFSGAVYVLVRDGMGAWSQQAYVKASNTVAYYWFGSSVALSSDGSTLAVGSPWENSGATGIGGDQADASVARSGAVYVLVRDGLGSWSQRAYVKASNTDAFDFFGSAVALSASAGTLAVGAPQEDGAATGIGGDQASDAAGEAGAVFIF